jgi:hypothetical protein
MSKPIENDQRRKSVDVIGVNDLNTWSDFAFIAVSHM